MSREELERAFLDQEQFPILAKNEEERKRAIDRIVKDEPITLYK